MFHIRGFIRLIGCALFAAPLVLLLSGAASAAAPNIVSYGVSPEFAGTDLVALDVTATLHAAASGTTTLLLPDKDEDKGTSILWRNIKDLKVGGAQSVAEDGPAKRIVKSDSAAALTLHYRLMSASPDPKDQLDPYAPVIRPRWFWSYGEALFVCPDIEGIKAQFHWSAPQGYPFASDLEHARGQPMAMNDLLMSVLIGGPDMRAMTRQIDGVTLRVAILGHIGFSDDDFTAVTSRIIAGERQFWGRPEGPFLVAIDANAGTPRGKDLRGDGRGDAFAIQAEPNASLTDLKATLAHEYFHTWNPLRMGGMAAGDQEPSSYWFSEGFTDFYKRRLLLRMGVYSLEDFIADWNRVLTEYAGSSVRLASNEQIVKRLPDGPDIHTLPYDRGSIVAARWDYAFKRQSHGKIGLDQVMLAVRDEAAKEGDKSPPAPDLFLKTAHRLGLDVRAEFEGIIEQGKPALLPKNAFGRCIVVVTRSVPQFDHGFDFMATIRNGGVVAGLEPGGPAERAGMKNGMRVRINEQTGNDSQKPLTYAYRKGDGTMGQIVFKPEGKTMTTLQHLVLLPNRNRARCAKDAGG